MDAVNRGFQDPNHADFTKPLQDLRDKVQQGRERAEKHAPAAPKPGAGSRPGNFRDAIERAKEATRAIPRDIFGGNEDKWPMDHEKLKEEVENVRRKIKPNPAKPYDWNQEIEVCIFMDTISHF